MDSEFKQFLDTLKQLGIEFSINWQPTKQVWQKIIEAAGYNVTALACTVVEIGNTQFLFSNGPLLWENEQGRGLNGLFMLTKNKTSNEVRNRTLGALKGRHAAIAKYPDQDWGMFE